MCCTSVAQKLQIMAKLLISGEGEQDLKFDSDAEEMLPGARIREESDRPIVWIGKPEGGIVEIPFEEFGSRGDHVIITGLTAQISVKHTPRVLYLRLFNLDNARSEYIRVKNTLIFTQDGKTKAPYVRLMSDADEPTTIFHLDDLPSIDESLLHAIPEKTRKAVAAVQYGNWIIIPQDDDTPTMNKLRNRISAKARAQNLSGSEVRQLLRSDGVEFERSDFSSGSMYDVYQAVGDPYESTMHTMDPFSVLPTVSPNEPFRMHLTVAEGADITLELFVSFTVRMQHRKMLAHAEQRVGSGTSCKFKSLAGSSYEPIEALEEAGPVEEGEESEGDGGGEDL